MSSHIRYLRAEEIREVIYWEAPILDEEENASETWHDFPLKAGNSSALEETPDGETGFLEAQKQLEEERQAILEEAYKEGRQLGEKEGFAQGLEQGLKKGEEEGRSKGERQGFEAGFEKGKAMALAEAREKSGPLWQALEEGIIALQTPLADQELALAEEINALVVLMVKAVIGLELKTNPDILLESIRKGLLALPSAAKEGVLYLNPEDKKRIEELGNIPSNFCLESDASIQTGGARIEARSSVVDATLEWRLQKVLEEVFGRATG